MIAKDLRMLEFVGRLSEEVWSLMLEIKMDGCGALNLMARKFQRSIGQQKPCLKKAGHGFPVPALD
jgi:hypothetical protein